jgi:hypothetical protein
MSVEPTLIRREGHPAGEPETEQHDPGLDPRPARVRLHAIDATPARRALSWLR